MKLFGRFIICWALAVSAGGAFAVSNPFGGPVPTETVAQNRDF